jgi:hypothetical protein
MSKRLQETFDGGRVAPANPSGGSHQLLDPETKLKALRRGAKY